MNFLEKVEKLPEEVKIFFTSNDCRFESEKSFFLYEIEISLLGKISKEIGMIFVGDEKLINLPNLIFKNVTQDQRIAYGLAYEINKRIFAKFPDYFKDSHALLQQWERMKSNPVISEEDAYKKLVELEPWILESKKEEPVKEKLVKFVDISILKAITIYSQVGEQLITSAPIKLKIFPQPVRPSIKNWIEDYRQTMGAQKHGMMERGNYLFHTDNTRRLTPGERKKLAEILRSLDEGVTLSIDPDRQEIVFEQTEEKNPIERIEKISNAKAQILPLQRDPVRAVANQTPNQNLKEPDFPQSIKPPTSNLQPSSFRFSSPQTFSSERSNFSNNESRSINQGTRQNYSFGNSMAGKPWTPKEDKNEPKIKGNIVDLRN